MITTEVLEKEVLRVGEAARLLGVSDETLRSWARRGLIACWRMPSGERRFSSAAILGMRQQLEGSSIHPVVEREKVEP